MIFLIGKVNTSGRKLVAALCTVAIGFALASLPFKITISGSTLELAAQTAFAKNGNSGNGNGGGNGNGNGGGNGNGKGGGGSSNSSSSSSSSGTSAKSTTLRELFGSVLRIRHVEGISEEIKDGRYIMKDARGRTIVNRRATSADQKRLLSLID
ncbi:hypothetical protein AU381_19875 [Sinorhizobium glycinis]|uniref:Glycine-rich cell wall protein n=1 Tax=Sinorhizobium glycinis TaxID=1472378 RepID=A0A178XNA7_9HYPH|nr:hypothetical protein [Sinorhizobium glycinis]OAP36738.1 hypothetical protein AU381_19875 [Sinorhizobium glycinis]